MSAWAIIRAISVTAIFLISLIVGQHAPQPEEIAPLFLIGVFAFSVVGVLFVIGMQRLNPRSERLWRHPRWSLNPFQMREPLQFFHFAGHLMLAAGAGTFLHSSFSMHALRIDSCIPLAFGGGILCGVRMCTVAYRKKMVHEPSHRGLKT